MTYPVFVVARCWLVVRLRPVKVATSLATVCISVAGVYSSILICWMYEPVPQIRITTFFWSFSKMGNHHPQKSQIEQHTKILSVQKISGEYIQKLSKLLTKKNKTKKNPNKKSVSIQSLSFWDRFRLCPSLGFAPPLALPLLSKLLCKNMARDFGEVQIIWTH